MNLQYLESGVSGDMNQERIKNRLINYNNALLRLKEALDADESNPFIYDAAIQRFEFTFELAWKLLKAFLEYEGIAVVNSPRRAFKESFGADLIHNGDVWIEMIDDRNLTAHTYDEPKAIEIYKKIKLNYYPQLSVLAQNLSKAINK